MRCFAPILAVAAIGLLSPSEIQASIMTLSSSSTYPAARAKSGWGPCHKKGQVYQTATAPDRRVESLFIPCPPYQPQFGGEQGKGRHHSLASRHLDSLRRRIHHEPPHCARCYATGILCPCCDHTPVVLKKGSPRYAFYNALAKAGMIVTF